MRIDILEPELEDLLEVLLNAADGSGFAELPNGYTPEIKELKRRGYLEKLDGDLSGNALVWLSYKGITYFKTKEKTLLAAEASGEWIGQTALSILKSLSRGVFSESELSEEEKREIARMSQQGLLSVRYTDNIPWLVSMTDLGELALKLGGWLPLAKDDGVFVSGSNNTYIYGDASNVQIQQGSEGCKQIGVEGKCPDAVKLLLELEENEGLRSLFGEKGREVFSCAKVAACGEGGDRGRALRKVAELLTGFGIDIMSAGAVELIKRLAGI